MENTIYEIFTMNFFRFILKLVLHKSYIHHSTVNLTCCLIVADDTCQR